MSIESFRGELYKNSFGSHSDLTHLLRSGPPVSSHKIFIVVNVLMYMTTAILYIIDFTLPPTTDDAGLRIMEKVLIYMVTIMYLCIILGFFIYG
jgi:type IV secretory pathway TrbL component